MKILWYAQISQVARYSDILNISQPAEFLIIWTKIHRVVHINAFNQCIIFLIHLDIDQALSHTFKYFQQFMPVDAMALVYTDITRVRMIPIARIEREGVHFYGYETVSEIPLYEDYFKHLKEMEADGSSVFKLNLPGNWHAEMLDIVPHFASCSTLSLQLKFRGHG